jgi:hypothetical protein
MEARRMFKAWAGKFFGVEVSDGARSMDIIIALGFYVFAAIAVFAIDRCFRQLRKRGRKQ